MSVSRTYSKKSTKRKQEDEPDLDSPKRPKIAQQPSIHSSPTLARDLSHIFDGASPSLSPLKSPSRSPGKLAKRMLGRSKTESSLDTKLSSPSSSSQSLLDRTSSLPTFASPPEPLSQPLPSLDESPSRPAVTNKRTYAGKSRSFLVELPASSVDQSLQDEEDDFLSRESYTSLRARWGVDLSEDDPYPSVASPTHSNSTTPSGSPSKGKGKGKGRLKQEVPLPPIDIVQPHKSITEIRNRGENRRFLDEVGYLLEGMDIDETAALKKASASEILNRLCDSEFARQAKAADFLAQTWEAFIDAGAGKGDDKVLDVLLAFFCALVSRDFGSSFDLAKRTFSPAGTSSEASHSLYISTIFNLLVSLTPKTDLLYIVSCSPAPDADLKKLGITKVDRTLLKSIHSTIVSKSQLFSSRVYISSALLLTHTLVALPCTLISCVHLPDLLRSFQTHVSSLTLAQVELESIDTESSSDGKSSFHSNGGVKFSDGKSSADFAETVPFTTIYNLLVLLDLYLLGQWAQPTSLSSSTSDMQADKYRKLIDQARDAWMADGLVAVGVFADLAPGRVSEKIYDHDSASKCTEMTFRVLVSLTHADPQWGDALIKNESAITLIVRTIVRADSTRYGCLTQKTVSNGHSKAGHGSGNGRKGKPVSIKKEDTSDDSDEAIQDGFVSSADRQRVAAQALDRLCLALGLLTNLVQVIDDAKNVLRITRFDTSCPSKRRPCIRSCTCPSSVTVLHILVNIYRHHLPDSGSLPRLSPSTTSQKSPVKTEPTSVSLFDSSTQARTEAEADASFLLGHLSILFGLLMMDSPENQKVILDSLPLDNDSKPAKGTSRMKLQQLVENAQKVGAYYAAISHSRASELSGDSDGLEDRARSGRDGEQDAARGENITKEVILFLKELKNGINKV